MIGDLRHLVASAVFVAGSAAAQPAAPPVVPPAPAAQPAAQPVPAARWTLAQLRQAYEFADTDSDGQLRACE